MTESAVVETTDGRATRRPASAWMKTKQIAIHTGHHPNTILLAFHEYDATKDTKEPKGLKGFQRVVNGPWKAHVEDVERWMHNLPPTKGIRRFAST